MSFPDFQKIKHWFAFALILTGSGGLVGCQALATGVDAILKQGDLAALNKAQNAAFSAFEQGKYDQAASLFQRAIEQEGDPELKAKLYNGLGLSQNELNQRSAAIAAYQEALNLSPKNAQVWVNLGIVQRLNEDYDEALESYEIALDLDDQLATAHSSIGSLWLLQGKPELAVSSLQKAIALDGTLAVSHGNLALAQAMLGQFDLAQASLARAVDLGYNNADVVQTRINELKKKS